MGTPSRKPRIGAHMSIAGGMETAVARAKAVDATALQVFCKSSNQWKARPFRDGEVEAFRRASAEADLTRYTLSHCSYLINLGSPDDALWRRSLAAFVEELERCAELGIPYVVVHPGAHVGSGVSAGVARVAAALDAAFDDGTSARARIGGVTVLLENTAGQGTTLGRRFDELAAILDRSRYPERLAVCFDTCHAFAAGYELRTAEGYAGTMEAFDRAIGLERLRAFHLNDSRKPLGSRRDRHAHIGEGEIGVEGFGHLLRDARFRGRPMVLETPKGDDLAEDRRNLAVLRGLFRR